MTTIKKMREVADKERGLLPSHNNFLISELVKRPKFFDWVNCRVNSAVNFEMFLGADDGVAMRYYWNNRYEGTAVNAWTYFAKKSGIILDIGAHTGAYTLAAYASNPTAMVFSFEPHFMNYSRLRLNLRGNGMPTEGAFLLAVSEKNGNAKFSIPTEIDYLSTGGSLTSEGGPVTTDIETVALDSFFAEETHNEVSLIKLDVEGHESTCLHGMGSILEKSKPQLFFECIEPRSTAEVEKTLSSLGYNFYEIDEETREISPTENLHVHHLPNGSLNMARLNRIGSTKLIALDELKAYLRED